MKLVQNTLIVTVSLLVLSCKTYNRDTFYTRGVDRMTDSFESLMAENSNIVLGSPFNNPDILWNSLKTKIYNYVENNGGSSVAPSPSQNTIWRPDWTKVRQVLRGEVAISDLGCN
ncbi:hypothetical protein [Flavobacterium sp. K5-23]|uniref:hypothetical protein n=1 Tax=Flavobacterium sp. K5-23 TaxID=2746225 RepID=UPI00200E84D5|nr:hypothetical protein [Flavobacterium sp. K5-23]UQD55675.1 hypothetical protein FLAK523_04405 [Flavobacterium sp. K5-23]